MGEYIAKECPEHPLWYDLLVLSTGPQLTVGWGMGIVDRRVMKATKAMRAVQSINRQVGAGAGALYASVYGWVFYPTCTKEV